jgi:hypothetical protein
VIAWLVEQAYRLVAHPRLVAQFAPSDLGARATSDDRRRGTNYWRAFHRHP